MRTQHPHYTDPGEIRSFASFMKRLRRRYGLSKGQHLLSSGKECIDAIEAASGGKAWRRAVSLSNASHEYLEVFGSWYPGPRRVDPEHKLFTTGEPLKAYHERMEAARMHREKGHSEKGHSGRKPRSYENRHPSPPKGDIGAIPRTANAGLPNQAEKRAKRVLKAIKKGADTCAQVQSKTGLDKRQIYEALDSLRDRVDVTRRGRRSVYSLAKA